MATGMANRHFGKVADVWKHLPLVEILAADQPTKYGETHAGSAGYRLADDSERRFGVMRFLDASAEWPQLGECRYRAHLDDLVSGDGDMVVCPGSPLLAMRELGCSARDVCCDLDADSVADISRRAARLGLSDRVDAVAADGMATITANEALVDLGSATTPGTGFEIVAAHISETARCRCDRLGDAG